MIVLSSNDGSKMAAFFSALNKAQSVIDNVLAGSDGYNFKYAELHQVLAAIRKPFSDNGLSLIQTPTSEKDESGVVINYLSSMITHESGEWLQSKMAFPAKIEQKGMSEIQAMGSMITYMRRYMASALVGIAQVDDIDSITVNHEAAVKEAGIDFEELKQKGIIEAKKGRKELAAWYKSQTTSTKSYLSKDKKGKDLMSLISANLPSNE